MQSNYHATSSNDFTPDCQKQPGEILDPPFDLSEIDLSDPDSVKGGLSRLPLGYIFPRETIEAMCSQGLAGELFPNFPMGENHPQVVALRDWVEPSIDNLWQERDLELRAVQICAAGIYATDDARRALILSVEEAGIFGALAQANLQEPMMRRRKGWPWWYRRWRRSPDIMPNLFDAFGEEWRASSGLLERASKTPSTNTILNGPTLSK